MSKDLKHLNLILNFISDELKKAGKNDASYLASLAAYSITSDTSVSSDIFFQDMASKKKISMQ